MQINHLFKKNYIIREILLYNFPVINLSIYVNNNAIIKKFKLETFKENYLHYIK